MDEYTIVEATETPARNPGDGLPRETAPPVQDGEDSQEEVDDTNGPWLENDVLERQKKMLDLGYMADISIKVQDQTFRCHKNIIAASSPKLAKMIRSYPKTLQLHDLAPKYFRLLLENFVDATSACKVLDFALQISDEDLKEACVKVIREQTDEVLKSDYFVNCNVAALQVILSQEIVHAVTELDLFLACARWAETRSNPRQALGSALSLIRYRVLSAKDFAKNVIPSKLLTTEVEKNLMLYFLTDEGEMPEGFSNEVKKRELFLEESKLVVGIEEEIYLNIHVYNYKYMTYEQINACPPLRFSVNRDMNLIGVKVWSERGDKKKGDKYVEDAVVTLKDKYGENIASAKFCELVGYYSYFYVRFSSPVPIIANIAYTLHYITTVPGERHYTVERL